jgi:2-oxoisovalerate dehydrogenase E1 component
MTGGVQKHLYQILSVARSLDRAEAELVRRGEAFFHVAAAGHEAAAAVNHHLIPQDYLHCHYRDKALLLARGVRPLAFLRGLQCSGGSASAGRQMSAHVSDPSLNVFSIVGPVGNNALQAVGAAAEVKGREGRPIVVCSLGDGTSQQGEVLEAIAEAVRWQLPVLFLIHDNRYSISTKTGGKTFYSRPGGDAGEFYGLPIHRLDGRDILACDEPLGKVIAGIRQSRGPAIVVLDVERLGDHTNADDETVYRTLEEIRIARETGDPIVILRRRLIEQGISAYELDGLEAEARAEVEVAKEKVLCSPAPEPTTMAKAPLLEGLADAVENRGDNAEPRLTMADTIRDTLMARMQNDQRVTLYGEDIEDPKGDVFRVTRGLSTAFPDRVRNSPVSESTIVGTSIGRALVGGRPVAFIQFADFLPLAFNQIATELGSMYWRTNGGWQCPVIVMAACGAYRPGLGPFHSHTLESVMAHVPGIDVAMPANATDAAGILNAAFESGRPTVFLYPKACLNDRESTTSAHVSEQFIPVGKSRRVRAGRDITLVAWGNTVRLCEKAASALAEVGCSAEVLDLRWLSPWDEEVVCQSAKKTGKLLVAHEDNHSAGFGAEVLATVAEKIGGGAKYRRVTRPDTYVPCHFGNQLEVLPSFKSVLTAAAEMLDLDLTWYLPAPSPDGIVVVEAIGSSPSDEMVTIAEWSIKEGQSISAGEMLACLECDKATFDLASPADGVIEKIHVAAGQQARVGAPLLTIRTAGLFHHDRQPARENPGIPHLQRRAAPSIEPLPNYARPQPVGISAVYPVEGADSVTNQELAARFGDATEEGIISRTGIERRSRVSQGQSGLSMAVDAACAALKGESLRLTDIDAIVCSTSTPPQVSPSMACLVLRELCGRFGEVELPAHDISAACTGYLYALGTAWDFLQSRPEGRVMVITTEEMSRVVDPQDFGTVTLFGDAATATIIYGAAQIERAKMRLNRPVLSAHGEDGSTLSVPTGGDGQYVRMDGKRVFTEAVRRMVMMLETACQQTGIPITDLDLIVPHQANGRIIEAVQSRLKVVPDRVRNNVRHHGNTSSSTIPLALAAESFNGSSNRRIGLCAFGAGYTFGAAILES